MDEFRKIRGYGISKVYRFIDQLIGLDADTEEKIDKCFQSMGLMKKGARHNMRQDKKHTENFLKGLTTLTGLPYKKIQQYAKGNNPFNILEHPHIMELNKKQLEK